MDEPQPGIDGLAETIRAARMRQQGGRLPVPLPERDATRIAMGGVEGRLPIRAHQDGAGPGFTSVRPGNLSAQASCSRVCRLKSYRVARQCASCPDGEARTTH